MKNFVCEKSQVKGGCFIGSGDEERDATLGSSSIIENDII